MTPKPAIFALVLALLLFGCADRSVEMSAPDLAVKTAEYQSLNEIRNPPEPSIMGQMFLTHDERCEVERRAPQIEGCAITFPFDNTERRALNIGSNKFQFPLGEDEGKTLSVNVQAENSARPIDAEYIGGSLTEKLAWVSRLEITYDGAEVYVPLSAYADISAPSFLSVRAQRNVKTDGKIFVRLYFDGASTSEIVQYTVEAVQCPDASVPFNERLNVSERLVWYPPMLGDSVQKSFYRVPMCN